MAVTSGGYDPRKIGTGGVYGRAPVPARPRLAPRAASQSERNMRFNDAGGRTVHYRTTGQDGTTRTNDVRWGGSGPDPLASLLQGQPPINPSGGGGGGGGRGRGGGGGGGGVNAATRDAYLALLGQLQNPDMSRFDEATRGVTAAGKAGMDRLAPIMQELDSRAATARTGVNESMSAGDARLAALQAEYQAAAGGVNDGLNASMAAFGAGPVQDTGAQSLQNLFANSRIANSRTQGVFDAGLADRPAVYGGLQADVQSGINRDQTGLNNQIAQARLAEQNRAKQEEMQLRAQLASMGIKV
jgi:hypothetical protein